MFVTADHGFATISKRDLDASGRRLTRSYAATRTYRDDKGRQEVNAGSLPPGFVAIDLAQGLGLPLFDPDVHPDVLGRVREGTPRSPRVIRTFPSGLNLNT